MSLNKRVLFILITYFLTLTLAFAGDIPHWVEIHFEKLGLKSTATLEEVDAAYKKLLRAASIAQKEDNVYSLRPSSSEMQSIESSYQNLKRFFNENPEVNSPKQHYFKDFSHVWVNETEPTNVKKYLDLNWKSIEPKLDLVFSTYPQADFDMDFDPIMGGRGRRVNPKIASGKGHYIAYDIIKAQYTSLSQKEITREQVDLFRRVVLLQMYTKSSFDEDIIEVLFYQINSKQIQFLNNSFDLLLENRENFKKNDIADKDKIVREIQKFLKFSKNKKLDSMIEISKYYLNAAIIMGNEFFVNEATPYIYSSFINELLFSIKNVTGIEKEAWSQLNTVPKALLQTKSPGFELYAKGMLAKYARKVKTQKDLEFFETQLWKVVKTIHHFESSDIDNLEFHETEKLSHLSELINMNSQLYNHFEDMNDEVFMKIKSNESIDFLLANLDNLMQKGCKARLKELL